ncbi:succinate dehydrogenase cytochrome b subunit [Propionicimonas sp. T2.31MG-18]|uniref:succinate dehydrogenase cytochrome b subunit n=1 Tax=Propionicimonas sp. T2.31MG-18 TaxID=3157620 RepID=UPI00366AA07F
MKALMAVTGLIMIGFLLMHMYGNLKMFLGAEAFDHYAEWLKGDILYPLVPKGWFIWIFRAVMVASVVLHMYSAITLWKRAMDANPSAYQVKKQLAQTYSARTMRWGGIILAGLLIFHLAQFTVHSALVAGAYTTPYEMVVGEFRIWWMVLLYAIWIATVCMHVRHGFWSAFATLGANTSAKARAVLNGCAWAVALLLYIGFMIMPVAVFFGWIN